MFEYEEIKMNLQEQIADLLFSVTNEKGSSHLLPPELCFEVTEEIVKIVGKIKEMPEVKK